MISVATPIWNEIAATQQLRTQWAKKMFPLDHDQLNEEWDKEADDLLARKVPEPVILGYLTVKPLFLENVAISQFIVDGNRDDLRMALPEVCSVNEAVMLASADRPLTPLQQKLLTRLLQKPEPAETQATTVQPPPVEKTSKEAAVVFDISVATNDFKAAMKSIEKTVKTLKPLDLKAEYCGKSLAALKRTNRANKLFDMELQFDGVKLKIVTSFATIPIPATGTASVSIVISGHTMVQVYSTFCNKELHFKLAETSVRIDTLKVPCSVFATRKSRATTRVK